MKDTLYTFANAAKQFYFVKHGKTCRQTRLIPLCHAEKHNLKTRIYARCRCKYSVHDDVESRSASRELFQRSRLIEENDGESYLAVLVFPSCKKSTRAASSTFFALPSLANRPRPDYSDFQLLLALDFATFILTPALLISSRTRSTTTRGAAVLPI